MSEQHSTKQSAKRDDEMSDGRPQSALGNRHEERTDDPANADQQSDVARRRTIVESGRERDRPERP